MAKVYGVHEIELRPGVDPKEFEQFAKAAIIELADEPDWHYHPAIGDHGQRNGKYRFLAEARLLSLMRSTMAAQAVPSHGRAIVRDPAAALHWLSSLRGRMPPFCPPA